MPMTPKKDPFKGAAGRIHEPGQHVRNYVRRHHIGIRVRSVGGIVAFLPDKKRTPNPIYYEESGALKLGWHESYTGYSHHAVRYEHPQFGSVLDVIVVSVKDKITVAESKEIGDVVYHSPDFYMFHRDKGELGPDYLMTFKEGDFSRVHIGTAKGISDSNDVVFGIKPWYLFNTGRMAGVYKITSEGNLFVALDISKRGAKSLDGLVEPDIAFTGNLPQLLEESKERRADKREERIELLKRSPKLYFRTLAESE